MRYLFLDGKGQDRRDLKIPRNFMKSCTMDSLHDCELYFLKYVSNAKKSQLQLISEQQDKTLEICWILVAKNLDEFCENFKGRFH